MILRKPYAFLIKKFKHIHLVLSLLLSYIFYKTNNIYTFLRNLIDNRINIKNINLVEVYLGGSIFVILIIILVITAIIYWLMRYKQKPRFIYLNIFIGYLIIFIYIIVIYNYLNKLSFDFVDLRETYFMRDVTLITIMYQFLNVVITLIRGIGFDIKKINFRKDLKELEINVEDEEEFELVLNVDSEKLKKTTIKTTRKLKYFLSEYKFINLVVISSILGLIMVFFFLKYQVFDKVYREKQNIKVNQINLKINNSYLTTRNYKYKKISKEGSIFVVIDFEISNKDRTERNINYKDFALLIDNRTYLPIVNICNNFIDIGECYKNEILKSKETGKYLLLYEIKENNYKNPVLSYKYSQPSGKIKTKKIKLSLKNINNYTKTIKNKLGETMSFVKSILGEYSLLINEYEIQDKFIQEYEICNKDKCKMLKNEIEAYNISMYDKTILKINAIISKKPSRIKVENNFDFINDFGYLRYKIADQTKVHPVNLIERTPSSYIGNNIYIEVLKEIEEATIIEWVFNIRDKQYIYILRK